jgi:hypothetical protein
VKREHLHAASAIALTSALAAAGCAGILGLGDATVVVGTDGGSSADASPPPSPESDAATDGNAQDATGALDAPAPPNDASKGAETGAATDAGGIHEPSAPCAQQGSPFFCADFDTSTTVGDGWSYVYISDDAGVIAFDTTEYTSSPRSARVVDPVQMGDVQLGLNVPKFSSWIHVAFDLRVDMTSLTGIAQTCVGQYSSPNLTLDYVLDGTPSAYLQEYVNGGPQKQIALPLPPLGGWTRITVAYDVATGSTVYEDGTLVASDGTSAGVTLTAGGATFGGSYINPPGDGPVTIELDNVVVRLQ